MVQLVSDLYTGHNCKHDRSLERNKTRKSTYKNYGDSINFLLLDKGKQFYVYLRVKQTFENKPINDNNKTLSLRKMLENSTYRVLQCQTRNSETNKFRSITLLQRSVISVLKAIRISVLTSFCVNRPLSVNDPHETITVLFLMTQIAI